MFSTFESSSAQCSKNITEAYSTSFSLGIKTLSSRLQGPIYAIYGMVRYADEIVDTFHDFDKALLLQKFKEDTFDAIDRKISLNPILFSFQKVVNTYGIPHDLIHAFFKSMEADLSETTYEEEAYKEYIYGSAEVVGLMCLMVFAEGDGAIYSRLQPYARALGAAFQKINFLRDMKSDYDDRGRIYFPGIDFVNFEEESKKKIEDEIRADFEMAYEGIQQLPNGAKWGVLLAYTYYMRLFHYIQLVPVCKIKEVRIRVSSLEKMFILVRMLAKQQLQIG
jgi:phytoene/squalene synthetase